MENKMIYGVDPSKEITAAMVRDAIIICLKAANKEILNVLDDKNRWESEGEREKFKNLQVELMVKSAFREIAGNFDNPSKAELIKVIDYLAKSVSQFREPEIIQKHYDEIVRLIGRIKD